MSTAEMLEDPGALIGVDSSRLALDILRSEQPLDLMIIDHMMPGIAGLELVAPSRDVRPTLPILLATGYAELPEGTQILSRAGQALLPDQLRERLDQLLSSERFAV